MTSTQAHGAGPLNRAAIAALLDADPPLLTGCVDLALQLQPNGFDLTVESIAAFSGGSGPGRMGAGDDDRLLPEAERVAVDDGGWTRLESGSYLITFNETVNLPLDLMALVRPRSSLLRSAVSIHTAVWDAGYHGRSQALLVVHHPAGYLLQRNARIAQMVFLPLTAATDLGYSGRYQHENL